MDRLITNKKIDALLKQGRVEEALEQPIKQPNLSRDGVAAFVLSRGPGANCLAEDMAYAGLTLGDFLYDYIRIDPEVVRGVEFARAADVDGILSFAHFADTKANLAGRSLDGLHSQLQGYVAEQIEAHHLIAQGHDVFFPATANNPGWDIMVDGHPFQVKCLADSGGVLEHLHRYPDIPVIVNADLADQVGNHAGVYVDTALHHDAILQATKDALGRGQDMADLDVPWISLGVSGAFNLYYMLSNGTDVRAMLACTATDTIGRTVGGAAGKFAGAAGGLLLFGPAGAIVVGVLGAIGGAGAGRRVVVKGKQLLVAEEDARVRAATRRVAEAAVEAIPTKVQAWTRKSELMLDSLSGSEPNQAKVQRAMNSHMRSHIDYWRQKGTELEALANDRNLEPESLFERLLTLVRRAGVHAHHIQEPLKDLGKKMGEYLAESKRFRITPS
jgi:hypothetical protein